MVRALGRALMWFWGVVLTSATSLLVVLQIMGPPPAQSGPAPILPPTAVVGAANALYGPPPPLVSPRRPIRPIAVPSLDLQEPVAGTPGAFLPRVGPNGSAPMQVYAGAFDRNDPRPRVGLLIAGFGLNATDSEEAIRILPPAITLAFSPYAQRVNPLLEAARARGHEFLVSLPLEPAGSPLNDAGNQSLLVSAAPEQNLRRLEWSLARISGYVGATGALGALRGERFASADGPMREMLGVLAKRGLLYVDPRPGAASPPLTRGSAIDLVIDESQQRTEIEANLDRLEELARDRGNALGLASAPLPVTVGRIAVWAAGLEQRGLSLVPVSALAGDPPAVVLPSVQLPPERRGDDWNRATR